MLVCVDESIDVSAVEEHFGPVSLDDGEHPASPSHRTIYRHTSILLADALLRLESLAEFCAVICWIDSNSFCQARQRDALSETTGTHDVIVGLATLAFHKPVIVIDQSYDDQFGASLIGDGVQDYHCAKRIDAERLDHSLHISILRHGSSRLRQAIESPSELNVHNIDWSELYQTYLNLPPREREVMDLLLDGNDLKEIAYELGKSASTVRTQITNLKQKFRANSLHHLSILGLRSLYEKNGETRQFD